MDREVRISDMVAFIEWQEIPPEIGMRQWWEKRVNAVDVGMKKDGTTTTRSGISSGTSGAGVTCATAKDSSASDGGTGSGGGFVADLMRELREASDYAWGLTKHIAPSVSNRMPSCTGVISQLDNAIVGLEKRAEAAEAKVKELEPILFRWSDAAVKNYPTRGNWAADPGNPEMMIGNIRRNAEEQIATLTRQLGEEREACDALRSGCGHVLDLINESEGVAGLHRNGDVAEWDSLISGNFSAWLSKFDAAVKHHDARREREKQNNGGDGSRGNAGRVAVAGDGSSVADQAGWTPAAPTNNGDDPVRPDAVAPVATVPSVQATGSSPSIPPATVTDEDRKVAKEYEGWIANSVTYRDGRIERLATLIASIRHQRDGEIRELVGHIQQIIHCVRYWGGYDFLVAGAETLIAKHGGGK